MSDLTQNQISDLVGGITALHPKLDSLANLLTTKLNTFSDSEVEEQAIHYWRTQVLRDALIRVRIFVERNFSYIETLGVLSLCRYTFELVVWLKHIEMDERFALFYARRLCNQQIEFYDDLANHLQREINLYCSLAEEESTAHAIVRAAARTASPSNKPAATGRKMADNLRSASNLIDEKLALEFAIYCDQINHNGYDFQVHLIKEQVTPIPI